MDNSLAKRPKSRDYPSVSLKRAVELARRIFDTDRWNEVPGSLAAKRMGYAGLNGGSRPALSALKKYGLAQYVGSGENFSIKLSENAKRIFTPMSERERAETVWEALQSPEVYAELLETFPGWSLPPDDTLAIRLERDFRIQHGATKGFIADLKESLEYAKQFELAGAARAEAQFELLGTARADAVVLAEPEVVMTSTTPTESREGPSRQSGSLVLPMPGSDTFLSLPERLSAAEGRRILSWIKRVVVPAVEFASDEELDESE